MHLKKYFKKLNKIVFTSLIIDSYKKIYANIVISTQMLKFDKLRQCYLSYRTKFAPINYIKGKKLKM